MDELAAEGHLSAAEVTEFSRSYDFLLRVRNDLHFRVARPTDILNLDSQPRVALNLGYTQVALLARVEAFMQDYYRSAQAIFQMSKTVESRLALAIGRKSSGAKVPIREALKIARLRRSRRVDGFVVRGQRARGGGPGRLPGRPGAADPGLPALPAARLHARLPPGPADPGVAPPHGRHPQSPDAGDGVPGDPLRVGRRPPRAPEDARAGGPGRFIPEFAALTCLVQHEFYHRYTADIHTLNAINELDLIFTEAEPMK